MEHKLSGKTFTPTSEIRNFSYPLYENKERLQVLYIQPNSVKIIKYFTICYTDTWSTGSVKLLPYTFTLG